MIILYLILSVAIFATKSPAFELPSIMPRYLGCCPCRWDQYCLSGSESKRCPKG